MDSGAAVELFGEAVAAGRMVPDAAERAALLSRLGLEDAATEGAGAELRFSLTRSREFGMVISAGLGGLDGALSAGVFRKDRAVVHASVELIEAGEFLPEGGQQRLAVLPLPGRLRLVPTDEVAPPALAGSHHDLLDLEGVGHPPEPARAGQHLLLNLRELADGHRQDVVTQAFGQLPPVRL